MLSLSLTYNQKMLVTTDVWPLMVVEVVTLNMLRPLLKVKGFFSYIASIKLRLFENSQSVSQ